MRKTKERDRARERKNEQKKQSTIVRSEVESQP